MECPTGGFAQKRFLLQRARQHRATRDGKQGELYGGTLSQQQQTCSSPHPLHFVQHLFPTLSLARHLPSAGGSLSKGEPLAVHTKFSVSPETCPLADVSRSREAFRCGQPSHSDFKSAEAENTVKRSSRRTGVNLQYFRLEPTALGSGKGRAAPFSLRGEGCPEGERGESKHPAHPLAQRNDPAEMHPAKAFKPNPRDCALHGKQQKASPFRERLICQEKPRRAVTPPLLRSRRRAGRRPGSRPRQWCSRRAGRRRRACRPRRS